MVDGASKIVKTSLPMNVPGAQGLTIPSGTRGQVIRLLHGNSAVVQWEVNIAVFWLLIFISPCVMPLKFSLVGIQWGHDEFLDIS